MWVPGLSLCCLLFGLAIAWRAARDRASCIRLMRLCAHELRSIGLALHGESGARGAASLSLAAAQVFAVAESLHESGPARPPALQEERVELAEALATAVAETSAAILPGTRLWRLPTSPAPALWADARALRHILGHVLADAVRATREGDWIEIELHPIGAEGLAITVTDEGAGLVNASGAPPVRRDSRGIGLRLALARQLLLALGGRMEVESHCGIGTCVRLILPAARLRPALPAAQAA